MNSQKASEKLSMAIKYNNGKIATTQLEQIMIAMIEPSQRAAWRGAIKIGLKAPMYADTIFFLRKIDNVYHQILALGDPRTGKVAWKSEK